MSPGEQPPFGTALPLGRDVVLLQRHPCGLLAFNKPAGLLSHPNEAGEQDRALLNAPYDLKAERYTWTGPDGSSSHLWLLNRLDAATSGVILAAESEALAIELKEAFRKKHVHKVYNALVFGAPSVPLQRWKDRLSIDKRGGQVRTSGGGQIPCDSQMSLLRRGRGSPFVSLILLEPRTGRSHQLRVQCALRRLPIVGDLTYGDFAANREFARRRGWKRLFLHSLETRIDLELSSGPLHFVARAPLPPEFTEALQG